ncbi:hypothetical protein [Achromobacter xylosoxidans]|uniref:hypothetical protein n=1 Tax=Alcaligenes xylosoxydans xylosoxydans TaxID=85698 RepID=UPI001FF5CC80|nr:hypothetical protein [Achromobacter xylosoxidans]
MRETYRESRIALANRKNPAIDGRYQMRVTLFQPSGVYPKVKISTRHSAFWADENLAFMVARCTEWAGSLPHSDVMWLNPEEIRLLGSMMMTERFYGGQRCTFRLLPRCHAYVDGCIDLKKTGTLVQIKKLLLETRNHVDWGGMQNAWTAIGETKFQCFPSDWLQMEFQPLCWGRVSLHNMVLLRGIYALIKADMLALEYEFREEATINTFIALDASFELVLRHLKRFGNPSPSSRDAGAWLYRTFDEPLGLSYGENSRYFEAFYDQRIQTLHPGSRLGDMPFAPLAWDDYSHLRSALPGIFGFLLTGRHTPEYLELFQEAKNRTGQSSVQ